jgi:4-amino-4-deoxy-L-arabinose transferase-like glycosyltransferase
LILRHVRRHGPALGLILIVALAVRLAWIAWIHPDPNDGRFDDTVWYRGSAHFISIGEGYLNPFAGTPTAAWPPGYPYFLGTVFRIFGEGLAQTYVANALLAVATVAVVYVIGVLLLERTTALVAAGALAVWPGQVYFTSLTLSEILFTFLLTSGVLALLVVPKVDSWRLPMVMLFGAIVALAVLTRGQALVLFPLAIVAWRTSGMRWQAAAGLGILAAVVAATPWVVRNVREMGSPVIVATNVGPNLWIGHHAESTGRMALLRPFPVPEGGDEMTQSEYEVAASNLALRKGLAYMLTHPRNEVRLSVIKIRAMYESDATALDWNSRYRAGLYGAQRNEDRLRGLANGAWFASLGLAAVGLYVSRSRLRSPLVILPLLVLLWTAGHLLFFGDSRFHYPIVFAIALLAARAVVVLWEALRRPRPEIGGRYAAA